MIGGGPGGELDFPGGWKVLIGSLNVLGPDVCGGLITDDLKTFAGWKVLGKDLNDLNPILFVEAAGGGRDGWVGLLLGGPGGIAFVFVFWPIVLKFEVINTMANQ